MQCAIKFNDSMRKENLDIIISVKGDRLCLGSLEEGKG